MSFIKQEPLENAFAPNTLLGEGSGEALFSVPISTSAAAIAAPIPPVVAHEQGHDHDQEVVSTLDELVGTVPFAPDAWMELHALQSTLVTTPPSPLTPSSSVSLPVEPAAIASLPSSGAATPMPDFAAFRDSAFTSAFKMPISAPTASLSDPSVPSSTSVIEPSLFLKGAPEGAGARRKSAPNVVGRKASAAGLDGVGAPLTKKQLRRESHNAVERRRRDCINNKIQEIGLMLPPSFLDSSNKSKGITLTAAVDYINHLELCVNMSRMRMQAAESMLSAEQVASLNQKAPLPPAADV